MITKLAFDKIVNLCNNEGLIYISSEAKTTGADEIQFEKVSFMYKSVASSDIERANDIGKCIMTANKIESEFSNMLCTGVYPYITIRSFDSIVAVNSNLEPIRYAMNSGDTTMTVQDLKEKYHYHYNMNGMKPPERKPTYED